MACVLLDCPLWVLHPTSFYLKAESSTLRQSFKLSVLKNPPHLSDIGPTTEPWSSSRHHFMEENPKMPCRSIHTFPC